MCENEKKKSHSIEMTTGSLWKNILLFSLPLMGSQVLELSLIHIYVSFHVAAELEDGTHYADTHDPGNCNPDGTHGQISGSDGRICR